MVDTNSPEFEFGRRIGYCLMTYIGISVIIKGTKIIIKSGRILFNAPIPTP